MTKKDSSCITKNTVKELLQIPHFSIIDKLYIFQLPETFDTETFFKCSKKNKNTLYSLRFCDTLSEAYKNRVEAIVDEIIETEGYDYKVPSICFVGLSEEKWDKLVKLILKY